MASSSIVSWPGEENGLPLIPTRDDRLYFVIRHIFLPPKLPNPLSNCYPDELLEVVHQGLARFRGCLNATQIPALDRCVRMVQCTMDVEKEARPPPALSADVRGRQIVNLEDNDCLAMPVYNQNAGLLITRVGADMLFEALELLAPDNVVGREGRLRRSFPSRAVVVARNRVIDPAFLQPFLKALGDLGLDAPNRPDSYTESEKPGNPRLVNDMVMGVLRGIGRSITDEHARIYKHSREEALMEVWSRSPQLLPQYRSSSPPLSVRRRATPPPPNIYGRGESYFSARLSPPPPLIIPENEGPFWHRPPLPPSQIMAPPFPRQIFPPPFVPEDETQSGRSSPPSPVHIGPEDEIRFWRDSPPLPPQLSASPFLLQSTPPPLQPQIIPEDDTQLGRRSPPSPVSITPEDETQFWGRPPPSPVPITEDEIQLWRRQPPLPLPITPENETQLRRSSPPLPPQFLAPPLPRQIISEDAAQSGRSSPASPFRIIPEEAPFRHSPPHSPPRFIVSHPPPRMALPPTTPPRTRRPSGIPNGETQFWRRSPLWLLTRVALQLTLHRSARQRKGEGGGSGYKNHAHLHGRPLYKAFMVFLMSCVLERAADEHMPHDLLFFMKAKLAVRVLKLGPAAVKEAWYGFPREVLRRVDDMLAERWDVTQSLDAKVLPLDGLSELNFVRDTQSTLGKLKEHLASIGQRRPAEALDDDVGVHNHPFRRIEMTDTPGDTFSGDEDLRCFELFAVGNWVENHTQLGNYGLGAADGKDDGAAVVRSQDTWSRGDCGGGGTDERGSEGLAHALFGGQSEDGSRWLRFVDNTFAKTFLAEGQAAVEECPQPSPPRLCGRCSALRLHDEGFEFLFSPLKKSDNCDLCKIIYPAVWPSGIASNRPVRVRREGTNLWADGENRPVLRLCAGPQWKGDDDGDGDDDDTIQIGLPQLLERRSNPMYDRLLRSWLQLCDDSHQSKFGCHTESQTALPTRVIDVGEDGNENPGLLRLVCTKTSDRGRYVALSHRWGKPGEETRRNCTFKVNLDQRRRRIDLAKLGKTFQDAVVITRAIGQRYLWIDSLCIVQDDDEDLEREFKRMETIFSLAYCVIAATAAEGPDTGFLKSRPPTRSVALPAPSSSSGPPLYICAAVDDFHGEVENANLNRRGWVLQERALARRTIHFSAGQTYWECGRGIHCESLSMLNNQEARFLGDPQFPKLALEQATADNARHRVFQAIFKTYSRLELTHATDRPNAIAGVERRLAQEMGSRVTFGVFDRVEYEYLHRSLLWRRAGDSLLQWINYPPRRHVVPTWSWMAHMGPIDYVHVAPPNKVEWNRDISLKITTSTAGPVELTAPVTAFTDEMLFNQHLLVLDTCRMADVRNLKCIVVGKELPSPSESQQLRGDEAYYILVVSPAAQTNDASIQYQRLGVATVHKAHLALDRGTERAHII
ncbi:hypothetical protein MAPG_10017 [Magnaporthiopsis poae ATCC 64411]|uniref:Uncharacterized protein n=1 Tax=Magnaporthiopsis poae (strain ATCC 64411 / 73-15) TaxID=644358 RepID=A0A0C4EBH0_MAGP6|nr:hypothetical protein MAPG_10017 [Magnaporthiopsis poae ATCC 64411]